MRETTAEIWIGPAQGSDFMGTQGGINATYLMLLRENSRAAWMLMPGNLYDSKPPVLASPKVWVPSATHPLEDALLQFAVLGAKVPEVVAVFREFVKTRSVSRYDVDGAFPKGFPAQIYRANRTFLKDWHIVVNVGDYSLGRRDIESLEKYKRIDIEVRQTTKQYCRD